MNLLTNFITILMIPMYIAAGKQLSCSEDTNAHEQLIPCG